MKKLIKKGLWGLYIDYPNHDTEIINESGIKLPLGHAGFALVDENGKSEYYDYGRYSYKGVGKQKNTQYLGNFVKRSIPDKMKEESPEEYAQRVGEKLRNALGEKKVVVSIVDLPNYNKAKNRLNQYLEKRGDYNAITNQTCAGVAADVIRQGRSFPKQLISRAISTATTSQFGVLGLILNRFPRFQRPLLSKTITVTNETKPKKLITKTNKKESPGLIQQGLNWLFGESKNNSLEDLQRDLKKLGFYTKSVDGLMGSGTRNAIAKAQQAGYKVDLNNFTVKK